MNKIYKRGVLLLLLTCGGGGLLLTIIRVMIIVLLGKMKNHGVNIRFNSIFEICHELIATPMLLHLFLPKGFLLVKLFQIVTFPFLGKDRSRLQ